MLPARKQRFTSENLENSAGWDASVEMPEECEDSGEDTDGIKAKDRSPETVSNSFRAEDDDTRSVVSSRSISRNRTRTTSSRQSSKVSTSKQSPQSSSSEQQIPERCQTLCYGFCQARAMDSSISNSLPVFLHFHLLTIQALAQQTLTEKWHGIDNQGQLKTGRRSVGNRQRVQQEFPKRYKLSLFTFSPVLCEFQKSHSRMDEQRKYNMPYHTTTSICGFTSQNKLCSEELDQHPDLAQEFSCTETPRNCLSNTSLNDMPSESLLSQRSISNEVEHKPQRFTRSALSTSPTSVISQASIQTVINALKPYILVLCNSEDLQECEAAVLTIAKIWEDSNVDSGIHSYLSSPTIINGFMEVLPASLKKDVLRTTVYILSRLIYADDRVGDLLTSIDSDFYCLVDLLKKGLADAAVLLYLLRPSFSHLSSHSLITTLLHIISNKSEDSADFQYVIAPKDAAIALLEEIVAGGDKTDRSYNARTIITENGIPALLNCLNRVDGRQSIVSILLCCIRIDITCKDLIANRIELSPVLELFHGGNDSVRGVCVEFLCELVHLSRRTLSNQILQMIKEEGTFSTMHTLLVYLQMSPMEQKPAVAFLLLQLDLLTAPRKMSIYREEAMEALLEALQRKDFPSSQIMALRMLSSLSGHLGPSRKPYMESWLLKIAGFDQPYNAIMRGEETKTSDTEFAAMKEEEKATRTWEKRMAFVLTNHERGMIFKALEECFKSNSIEIAKSCLVVATWLVYMLYSFPDCGIRDVACKSLLDKFINVLQSSKNLEEKILAALALRGFISEPGGLQEMGLYAKSVWKTLRRLKKNCIVVHDIMKALMNLPSIDAVWDTGKSTPRLIQEAREHSKAVTCLYVPPACDKLYSGSLDKTIRVWSIKQEEIHCIQVHDVKEAVLALAANASFACFSTQGNGVKVYNWSGVPKSINFNKQVKCLAMDGEKLYCGCSGYSIQEVDLGTHTSSTFYSGAKRLLGKQTIYAVEIHNGLLYACGSSVDGIAGKVFKLSSKAVIGTLPAGLDIQQTTVNNDFIFTATKCGVIEVWLKDRLTKIAYVKTGSGNARITATASDAHGQKLFAGTSDGRLQVWSLD
ncbi:UNVERIFIED_CONTAM: putative E3 ubiquitin-protein ligase LIN [Sesamum radiatum]|uniref:E3 ubiquitin-protein ligase LIN n=1 Tax=Sesamum radiatum TaxID=300843 RepID=A0AAW2M455_SESRA